MAAMKPLQSNACKPKRKFEYKMQTEENRNEKQNVNKLNKKPKKKKNKRRKKQFYGSVK